MTLTQTQTRFASSSSPSRSLPLYHALSARAQHTTTTKMATPDIDVLRAAIPAIAAQIRELKAAKADDALVKEQQAKLADVNRQIAALAPKPDASASTGKGRLTLKTPKVRPTLLLDLP